MEIVYRKFSKEFLDSVIKLEKAWADENITYGLEQSGGDYFLEADNNYFYLALDGNKTIGYVICEKVEKNEYNIFPKGAVFIQVNDLYILQQYRKKGIGENLLKAIEKEAKNKGINHIFISTATKDTESILRFYGKNGYKIWTTLLFRNIE